MENKGSSRDLILKMLQEKSLLKQDLFIKTKQVFANLKAILKEIYADLKASSNVQGKLSLELLEKGEHEIELRIAGDSIIFVMHTNIFTFDRDHSMWKTSYIQKDNYLSYCGVIYVYNFLADSFRYNRVNDIGYMIARLYINKEMHFFVEGKRQMGFLYNDFAKSVLDNDKLRSVLESAILYCLDFDLYTPAFNEVKEISVQQILESTIQQKIITAKRLGFRFQADDDKV